MAIGRISGPMLVQDLERQGTNLSFDGNLLYLDVANRRIGVNTNTPNVALDVVGSANISSNLYIGGTVTVGNLYQLPVAAPEFGQVLTALGGGTLDTYWAPGPLESGIYRRTYQTTITGLLGFGSVDLTLNLGISSVVYGLSVSRPVKVEIFGTPARDEPNPYTFIATPDHLMDDGTVVLNDGSSFQSRQYSIFANMEDPPKPNVYATITSLASYQASDPVVLTMYYYPAVTDNKRALDILDALPTSGQFVGKMVYLTTNSKLYIWVNGAWNQV